jgi:peptide/nickel transport system substrate-binding protein
MQRLNPVLDYANPVDRDVNRLLFSSLLRFDGRGLPQPDLAEAWGVSKDGTVYNVTLRKNLKWHDGRPVTSEDILYTIDLIRNGPPNYIPQDLQAMWKDVDVQAFGEDTVQFKLPEPFAPFVDYLTFGILPRHVFQGEPSLEIIAQSRLNLNPIGSGPYKFDHLIVENNQIAGVALSIFDGYYGKRANIEQFVFRYYPDGAAALKAYQDGTVQGIGQVPATILADALAAPSLALYTGRRPEQTLILFNHKDQQATFLSEPAVRRALMFGLNRAGMISQLLNGQAIVSDGPIFPGTWAYYEDIEKIQFDPEKARSLLKDAGYVTGTDKNAPRKKGDLALSFELFCPDDEVFKAVAGRIQKDWEAIGVQLKVTPLPYDQLVNEKLNQRTFQAALVTLNFSRSADPDPYPFWDQAQATGGQNYTQWDNRSASEYIEAARATIDIGERTRLYRNFQVIFTQEMPALPLYYPVYSYGVDRQVQGVRVGPLFDSGDRFFNVTDWYLVTKKGKIQLTPSPSPTP